MVEPLTALLSAPVASSAVVVAGALLGAIFYGGLWWTTNRIATFDRPASTMLASSILRTSIALGGFYVVGGGQWMRLLLCLLGFLLGRVVVTRVTRLHVVGPVRLPVAIEIRDAP